MSRCNNSTWSSQLPWVLLGLRTTPKEGVDASPAEMVFGEPLVVPGEFFPDAPSNNNISRLRNIVGKLAPCKQTYKPPDHCYIPRDLHSTKHVFLRTDAQTPPLTPPYSGPYEVIERRKKRNERRQRRHERVLHRLQRPPPPVPELQCPECGRLCGSRIGLYSHRRTHRQQLP
ncbi:hypothetical protein Pcinc_006248 [Petrolisthes cinctipes]|uniref:C2H2-type domain-containing protein n=1 Tax=Petrolisthes cinctipes TaxID=88211 RepID=A0AAE1GD91_PETCI|nr:hypothetical protein Pcinc_006248 [Petrolisthes cinctipes]